MTAEQFTYWLQGYAELTEGAPSPEQWQSIRDHLALVFHKATPPVWPQDFKTPAQPWVPGIATCVSGGIAKRNGDHAIVTC